jgi:predicted nuclease of predicted toxin-antitoxin system
VRILLDENFPPALYRRLRDAGVDVEHVRAFEAEQAPLDCPAWLLPW